MSTKNLDRRLRKLETPARLEYLEARARAFSYTLRSFGAELKPHEEHDLGPGYDEEDFEADCEVMERYRASLDPEKRKREQHSLMTRLYSELERRGIDSCEDVQVGDDLE